MKKLSPQIAETRARWLAQTASACLTKRDSAPNRVWSTVAATARIRT